MFWCRDSQDRGYSASTSTSPERRAPSRDAPQLTQTTPQSAFRSQWCCSATRHRPSFAPRMRLSNTTPQLWKWSVCHPWTTHPIWNCPFQSLLVITSVKIETGKAVFAHRAKAGRVNIDHRIWLCRCFLVVCRNGDKYWSVEIWFMRRSRAHAAVKNGYTCLCKAEAAQTSSEYYAEQYYWVTTQWILDARALHKFMLRFLYVFILIYVLSND